MKCDSAGLGGLMRLWAQPMAVVEMEQISRTNLDFISESSLSNIPIWQNLKKTWTRIKECDFFFLFFFWEMRVERLRKKSKVFGRVFLKVDQLVGREIARESLALILSRGYFFSRFGSAFTGSDFIDSRFILIFLG